jgi:hypothetical protein|tara:strand:- start:257 stop:586 length:330 start_codon:yes stop_codon:yes gene_type:complete
MSKVNVNGLVREATAEEQAEIDARETAYNSNAEKLNRIKSIRIEKLRETDWWVFRGEMTDEQKAWRKSLRDIPTTFSASNYDALLAKETDKTKDTYGQLTHSIWTQPTS